MKNRFLGYCLLLFSLILLGNIFLPHLVDGKPAKIPLARMEISNLSAALTHYQAELAENPSGTKANILKTLLGENSKKLPFLHVNPKAVNSRGEFMDPWKTPYQINIIGQTNFIIRSAGPNRIFGDKDDLISKSEIE